MSHRPKHRLIKDLDLDCKYGIFLDDLTKFNIPNRLSDIISIEIKPKSGILPLHPELNFPIKYKVCRYCMHQETKLLKGEITKKSDYCPLDLFSNNSDRIYRALENLFKDPQNNLKLFINHEPIQIEKFPQDPSKLIKIIYEILTVSNILSTLLKAQMLDQYDIEYISTIYDGKSSCLFHNQLHEDWIEPMLAKVQHFVPKEYTCRIKNDIKYNDLPKNNDNLIREFLVAHTAKDCSIMMSFCQSKDGKMQLQDESYEYKIAIVDTDPKFAKDIPKYQKLDQEIAKTYQEKHIM